MSKTNMGQEQQVAVVTGANKGLGFEICSQLLARGVRVILTARDENKGRNAIERLDNGDNSIQFFRLDVTSSADIQALKSFLENDVGRCDILVNNAGIFPDPRGNFDKFPSVLEADVRDIDAGMRTNVYGPLQLIQAVIPLMRKYQYGRIVNMSSGMGQLSEMNGCCPGYRISKTALNVLTRVFADELQGTNILINSLCPGWVKTDMGGPGATRELSEGADTAVWLAMLEDDGPTGQFFRDRKVISW